MDARSEKRLKTFADRYAKVCNDLKEQEERKKKIGQMLQDEMVRQNVLKVEGTEAICQLIDKKRKVLDQVLEGKSGEESSIFSDLLDTLR